MKNKKILTILALLVVIIIAVQYGSREMYSPSEYCMANQVDYSMGTHNQNDVIGLIYPPRAGPLHTNIEYPYKNDKCRRDFTAIFKNEPYVQTYSSR